MWTMRKEFDEPEPESETVSVVRENLSNIGREAASLANYHKQSMTDTNQPQPVPRESTLNCECPQPQPSAVSVGGVPGCPANVVTIPVPILQAEGNFAYVTVKGSLHDYTCSVFGLNQAEIQALSNRLSVKPCVNGIYVAVPPMVMLNTLAQLSYKVVCSCGEAEICWTLQREV